MPKLPKNMVKRGTTFVYRHKVNGRSVRENLGTNYEDACRRLRPSHNSLAAASRWCG